MQLKVVRNHPIDWEVARFNTFAKGTLVNLSGEEDVQFKGWYPAIIEGHETFVPKVFVCNGKLNRDYNPTELKVKSGDVLKLQEIVNAWLIVTNAEGLTGWIPAECVVSAHQV